MDKLKIYLRNLSLIGVCFLFSSVAAFADETKPNISKHRFEIGLQTMHFDYGEESNVDWDGYMYGIAGSYNFLAQNKVMIDVSLEYFYGDLDYDGRTWGGSPLKADTDDWIVGCRILGGYHFDVKSKHGFTPFAGIGYRYWNEMIHSTGGYEREIEYWYSPIGIKTISPLWNNWRWGISVEYDLFWGGSVKSHFSDVLTGYNDPKVDLNFGGGHGFRFSLQFSRKFMKSYILSIEPYIRYWDMDNSEIGTLTLNGVPVALVYEPENDTTACGVFISVGF